MTSWKTPIYRFKSSGKPIVIDVTKSLSSGLPPHKVVKTDFIPLLRRGGNVRRVLDFGAGALRHTFPMLKAGFEVCAVEFEEAFTRPVAQEALAKARKNPNFSTLIWPHDFVNSRRRFDAAILAFVTQTMPRPEERATVIRAINKKLIPDGYLLYMSRYGQITQAMKKYRVSDGYFMSPKHQVHSFYREFTTEETHATMEKRKLKRLHSWSARGTEQVYLYQKSKSTWI